MLRTDTFLNMREQPNPGICKQTETAVPAKVLANCLPCLSPKPSMLINVNDEVTSGDVHVLSIATPLGSHDMLAPLLEEYESFESASYIGSEVSYRIIVGVQGNAD
jgi:hypothetical protein